MQSHRISLRAVSFCAAGLMVGLLGCSDAKPGATAGGGGQLASGGAGGAGVGGAGGMGGGFEVTPNFTAASATSLSHPGPGHDAFGCGVAVSGDTVVVGARQDADGAPNSGAAYVYVHKDDDWSIQAKLKNASPDNTDKLGWSVAIDGDVVVAGAPQRVYPSNAGAAFVFRRNGSSWVSQQELRQAPPEIEQLAGYGVAVSGSQLLVGAPRFTGTGNVSTFQSTGGAWKAGEVLSSNTYQQVFGRAVALDGNTAVVGAPAISRVPRRAYVFVKDGNSWSQQAELMPGDGTAHHFGLSVAVSGDTLAVGTGPLLWIGGPVVPGAGGVYIFVRRGGTWMQEAKVVPDNGDSDGGFGYSVALNGNTLVVGEPFADGVAEDSGAAYVFTRSGSSWSQQTKWALDDGVEGERFGLAVAVDGKLAVVGGFANSSDDGRAVVYQAP